MNFLLACLQKQTNKLTQLCQQSQVFFVSPPNQMIASPHSYPQQQPGTPGQPPTPIQPQAMQPQAMQPQAMQPQAMQRAIVQRMYTQQHPNAQVSEWEFVHIGND